MTIMCLCTFLTCLLSMHVYRYRHMHKCTCIHGCLTCSWHSAGLVCKHLLQQLSGELRAHRRRPCSFQLSKAPKEPDMA